jgi:chemotaxis protein CheY-P-specific phosphatase CheC
MLQQKTAKLTTIFSEVLANLAFMFTDDDPAPPTPGEIWFETQISYEGGTERGTLLFLCNQEFARQLAANLLGIDPDEEDADLKGHDAVKEFMNIVCGQFVTAVHGSEQVFDLTIPAVQELSETPDLESTSCEESCTLSVEGTQIQLRYVPGESHQG